MKKDVDKVREFLKKKPRYSFEAYHFVLQSLRFLVNQLSEQRHVTGPELLTAVRDYGFEQYGFLASLVFESWSVKETVDIGHIVFDLVEMDILRKTDEDTLEDFKDVYVFETAFREGFLSSLEQF